MNSILTPPSFVEGMTPADVLAWGRSEDGSEAIEALLTLYDEDTAAGLLLTRYSRIQLVALLTGQVAPTGDGQATFLTAMEQGQPMSLLGFGHEDLADSGFVPTLQKVETGWRWQFGTYSDLKAELPAALQQYAAVANRLVG